MIQQQQHVEKEISAKKYTDSFQFRVSFQSEWNGSHLVKAIKIKIISFFACLAEKNWFVTITDGIRKEVMLRKMKESCFQQGGYFWIYKFADAQLQYLYNVIIPKIIYDFVHPQCNFITINVIIPQIPIKQFFFWFKLSLFFPSNGFHRLLPPESPNLCQDLKETRSFYFHVTPQNHRLMFVSWHCHK